MHAAAERLGVSEATIVRLLARGELRRLAGIRRILIPIPHSSIDAYINGGAAP